MQKLRYWEEKKKMHAIYVDLDMAEIQILGRKKKMLYTSMLGKKHTIGARYLRKINNLITTLIWLYIMSCMHPSFLTI